MKKTRGKISHATVPLRKKNMILKTHNMFISMMLKRQENYAIYFNFQELLQYTLMSLDRMIESSQLMITGENSAPVMTIINTDDSN
jgi:hypothetical protein